MPRAEFFASVPLKMGAQRKADRVVGLLAMGEKGAATFQALFPQTAAPM